MKTILLKNYKCKLKDYSTFFKIKVKYNTHERKLKKKNKRRDRRKKGIRKKINFEWINNVREKLRIIEMRKIKIYKKKF